MPQHPSKMRRGKHGSSHKSSHKPGAGKSNPKLVEGLHITQVGVPRRGGKRQGKRGR